MTKIVFGRVGGYDPDGPPPRDPTLPGASAALVGITPRAWARSLDADRLDGAARGSAAADDFRRAARNEMRRRGRCCATNDDGDICQRVKGHSAALDHERVFGLATARWNYDARAT